MIITVCGFIGSGKDTIAEFLVDKYNFRQESFAGSLKDTVSAVFGWDRNLLDGKTEAARKWREQVDTWWADKLGIPQLTPRYILQQWGTEVCRNHFHKDIWVASLENRLLKQGGNIVISDCRFLNEVQAMRNLGSKVIRVKRGPEPIWYNLGLAASDVKHPHYKAAHSQLLASGIHASEWSWLSTQFDHVIENNGTLKDLTNKVTEIVSSELSKKKAVKKVKSLA